MVKKDKEYVLKQVKEQNVKFIRLCFEELFNFTGRIGGCF